MLKVEFPSHLDFVVVGCAQQEVVMNDEPVHARFVPVQVLYGQEILQAPYLGTKDHTGKIRHYVHHCVH